MARPIGRENSFLACPKDTTREVTASKFRDRPSGNIFLTKEPSAPYSAARCDRSQDQRLRQSLVVKKLIIYGIMAVLVFKIKAGFTSPLRAVDVGIAGAGSRGKTTPLLVNEATSGNELGREGTENVGGG